ncbi:Enoyl-CoA hydratase/carnithine racemase [Operophtera brumata]|uniref:Enoyl-CoA hydratase/carnithine racemase n=1 Tax=Operophtera brumata TaxID=104452 RepID=A0A0L7LS52_OPEBR|nr:Enoyl-CoA hydratase/carnithine racemase [Operophtera brumata]
MNGTKQEAGSGSALDDIERVLLRRRCFEEWKRVSGLSEQVVSPELLGNHTGYWEIIINGEAGKPFSGVSEIGAYALSVTSKDSVSWSANQVGLIAATLTGIRTPLALNLNTYTLGGRYDMADAENFGLLSAVGGGWQENRYGHRGSEAACTRSVGRALNRLNLQNVGHGVLTYATKPQQHQVTSFAYRLDTAVFTITGHWCNWQRDFNSIDNAQQAVPAFGWGLLATVRDYEA